MKSYITFVVTALATSSAIAQPTPSVAPAKPVAAKPCEPATPETDPNGELIYTGCQVKVMGGALPRLTSAPKGPDLSGLYKKGVQGEVVFNLIIGKDGSIRNVAIKGSSRSPELDAIATGLVNGSKFSPAADHDGKPVDVRAELPMYFWKDSMADPKFFKKTCRDFLTDVDWRTEHFPEEKPEQYRGWLLAKGAMVISSIRAAGGLSAIGQSREFPKTPTYSDVIDGCKAKPDRIFFDVLTGR
jgi:TonB family protein